MDAAKSGSTISKAYYEALANEATVTGGLDSMEAMLSTLKMECCGSGMEL